MFSILGEMFGASKPSSGDDFWFTDLGRKTASGMYVNEETAMRTSAVYACVKVLSETIGSLPLNVMERRPNGSRVVVHDHELHELLHDQPNDEHTSVEFRELQQAHLSLRGNSYAEIVSGPRGFIDQLIPLHPDRVGRIYLDNGSYKWRIKEPDGYRELSRERIHHVKGLSLDGVTGISPISYMREQIGATLAATNNMATFFSNDMQPSGVLEHPTHFKDSKAFDRFKESWRQSQSGNNRYSTAILEHGIKYNPISMTAKDAQFIETMKFQVGDVARMFRMPPHMIGDLDRATNNNIEHQGIELVVYTFRPWIVKSEQAIRRDLISNKRKYYAKYIVEGLLRGDTQARYESYSKGINDGWLLPNEAREKEDMNPIPGGDKARMPLNMTTTEEQASSVVRREIIAVSEAHDKRDTEAFNAWCDEYYSKFRKYVRESIDAISMQTASNYVNASLAEIKQSDDVKSLMQAWQESRADQLAQLVENQSGNEL